MTGSVFLALILTAAFAPLYEEPHHLAAQASVNAAEAKSRCAPALVKVHENCVVDAFGNIGAVQTHDFFYARYTFKSADPADLPYPRVVIFEKASSAMLRPILISGADPAFDYRKPTIVRGGGRLVLHIPAYEPGTGNFNRESVYLWAGDGWRDADVKSWLADLARRLPKGLAVWKGVYPDYAAMKAETPLWREKNDPNCCPTGGRAKIDLEWRGNRIAARALRVEKGGD
jgi:hypothetical protein